VRLRDYQRAIFEDVMSGSTHDIVQLETGAGKTPIEAALAEANDTCILVAHRNILIAQISEKLAAFGLDHDTVSSEFTRRRCIVAHRVHRKSYIVRGNTTRLVASIDSLTSHARRGLLTVDRSRQWTIIVDEAHHVVPGNKWGQLLDIFPFARIIGFTATPARNDGESLHVDNRGAFERLVQAPSLRDDGVRELIRRGHLSDFVVYAPRGTTERNDLAACPIATYLQLSIGRRAVMMCPSIKNAEEFADEFRAANVSAACISSAMSATSVARIVDAFSRGEIEVLCNVDMVGEGFDVPGIETMILARRTSSFVAYRQWIGRALRPCEGKSRATVIDLVGNVELHGMPDEPVEWDLLDPPSGVGLLQCSPCSECFAYYRLNLRNCPHCGAENALLTRNPVGGHYVNLRRLDMGLVEKGRLAIETSAAERRLEREVVFPYFGDNSSDLIGRTVDKIRRWFIASLATDGVEPRILNEFLRSSAAKDRSFWASKFTVEDVNSSSTRKQKRVLMAWQRSH